MKPFINNKRTVRKPSKNNAAKNSMMQQSQQRAIDLSMYADDTYIHTNIYTLKTRKNYAGILRGNKENEGSS